MEKHQRLNAYESKSVDFLTPPAVKISQAPVLITTPGTSECIFQTVSVLLLGVGPHFEAYLTQPFVAMNKSLFFFRKAFQSSTFGWVRYFNLSFTFDTRFCWAICFLKDTTLEGNFPQQFGSYNLLSQTIKCTV